MQQLWNNPGIREKWFYLKRYYAVNWSFYEMQPHIHSEVEIMYVVYGECIITCYDREGVPHTRKLRKEEYVLIDACVPHTLYVPRDSSCRILNLEIAVKNASSFFRIGSLWELSGSTAAFLQEKKQFCFQQDENKELLSIITGLQSHAQTLPGQFPASPDHGHSRNVKEQNRLSLDLYFSQFLVILAEHAASDTIYSSGNRYVMGARRFMEENLENTVTVSAIAHELGISEAYLQRIYKLSCGETLVETLNRLRMEKACVLLAESKLPVIEVAIAVGFNSRQHFSYTFTKYMGYSPAKYRSMKGYTEVYEGFQDTSSHKIVHPRAQA